MSSYVDIFCLDTNVLIQAWQKYYSPDFCSDYWKILDKLGLEGRLFIPEMVFEEISRTEDDLSKWLKDSNIQIKSINEAVSNYLKDIYAKNEMHKYLVDNIKGRSLADPWVIAHALYEKAVVVTKEEKLTVINSRRIKIPNVCENMGIPWTDDFGLIRRLNIKFYCEL